MATLLTARLSCAAARVMRNTRVCEEHVELELSCPELPPSQPGQFVELHCTPEEPARSAGAVTWSENAAPVLTGRCFAPRQAFLNRPFSIADRWDPPGEGPRFTIISHTIGPGTAFLEQLRVGQTLQFTGPLGSPFQIPEQGRPMLLVGGGVGIPPLLYLARRLHERGHAQVALALGVRTGRLFPLRLMTTPDAAGRPLPCCELPAAAPFPTCIATDDGTLGLRGLVTDLVDRWRQALPGAGTRPLVFACGPERMLAALAQQTRALGSDAQLCIERQMGCGLGTCLSCVVRVNAPQAPHGWRWALSCQEGPVFDRDALYDYNA